MIAKRLIVTINVMFSFTFLQILMIAHQYPVRMEAHAQTSSMTINVNALQVTQRRIVKQVIRYAYQVVQFSSVISSSCLGVVVYRPWFQIHLTCLSLALVDRPCMVKPATSSVHIWFGLSLEHWFSILSFKISPERKWALVTAYSFFMSKKILLSMTFSSRAYWFVRCSVQWSAVDTHLKRFYQPADIFHCCSTLACCYWQRHCS